MTSPASLPVEDMVRELWDRQQITDVMLRFGRGLDLHDWEMYAATLTDPFEVDFFDLTGRPAAVTTPKVWAQFASACLERLVVMHQYSNFHISVRGEAADGVFYHTSRHRLPNRFGDDHYTQYGWYENSYDPGAITAADLDEYVDAITQVGALRAGLAGYQDFFATADQVAALAKTPLEIPVRAYGGEACLGGLTLTSVQAVAPAAVGGVIERCGHWAAEERPDFVADLARELAA
jgi:pimeloyl-ACP methyl ester carboxylesterase